MAESKRIDLATGVDALASALFGGRTRTEAHANGVCVECGKPAKVFKDDISAREYRISGLCQECQDDFFGSEPPE